MSPTRTPAARSLVLVTGGSSGIGLEIARLAARDGHHLLLVARGEAALETAAETVRADGAADVHVLSADLSSRAGVDSVVGRVEELDLPLAALVNNAGAGAWGPLSEQDPERLQRLIDLNCTSVMLLTRLLLARLRRAQGGVLTVASTAAFQPGPGNAVYHASKAFALSFSVALREELRGHGVRVTALCPGPVDTGFNAAAGVTGMDENRLAQLALVDASDVARAGWTGLASDRAVVVPGRLNRLSTLTTRMLPLPLATRMARGALGALDRTGAARTYD